MTHKKAHRDEKKIQKHHPSTKAALKQSYLIKLGLLESKYPFFLTIDKLNLVLKEFFKDYFHLHYEFTLEELNKELKTRKIAPELKPLITQFLRKLENIRYAHSEDDYTEQDTLKLCAEAKFLIEHL